MIDSTSESNGAEDTFLKDLEDAVRAILKGKKISRADKLSAIGHGTKLLAIRHKINGGDDDKGFFSK